MTVAEPRDDGTYGYWDVCALDERTLPGDRRTWEYADTVMNLVKDNANPEAVGFDGFSPECGFGSIDAEKKAVRSAAELSKSWKQKKT